MKKLVLVADDESHIREVVLFALSQAGFETIEASNGKQAVELFEQEQPQLIILDVLMPEMDGTEVCKHIRSISNVPILFLSSRDDEIDKVLGLELGGDDYITKPFSPREVVARVKAVFRRMGYPNADQPEQSGKKLKHGKLRLDPDRFEAFWEDHAVVLTSTEFGLLRTLLGFPGKVFSRDELMSGAYDYQTTVTDRTIDSHIRRLRKKFKQVGSDPVETVHGVGYRLGPCE